MKVFLAPALYMGAWRNSMITGFRTACVALLVLAGCSQDNGGKNGGPARTGDMAGEQMFETLDLTTGPGELNACGDTNPTCTVGMFGPPFPLQRDSEKDAREDDEGISRDDSGHLGLDQSHI